MISFSRQFNVPNCTQVVMHRFDSTIRKVPIAELHVFQAVEQALEQEDDLFNEDAFNDAPKSNASWTCVVCNPLCVDLNRASTQTAIGSTC